jgi:hypothetical protein
MQSIVLDRAEVLLVDLLALSSAIPVVIRLSSRRSGNGHQANSE